MPLQLRRLLKKRVRPKKLKTQVPHISPIYPMCITRQPSARGPSIGGLGPNVKEGLLNSPVSHQVADQLQEKRILSTYTIRAHDFKILLKAYLMVTGELLPDILALLNIGADFNIIDFQFIVNNVFVFKPIAQLFCIHNVNGTLN